MESKRATPFLLLLLPLLQVCTTRGQNCPSLPDKDLSCYNDYNRNITCFWNSTSISAYADHVCTIHAKKESNPKYNSSCPLQPVDPSIPAVRKCSLIFHKTYIFSFLHTLTMNVSCIPLGKSQITSYKPVCHVKPNPPPKPCVNSTSVSWLTQVSPNMMIPNYGSQLQWKQMDQSWNDPAVQKKDTQCPSSCEAQLDPDLLVKGEMYEARVRVKATGYGQETWSEWSPSESWTSDVGKMKSTLGVDVDVMKISLIVLGVAALVLVVILHKTDKIIWIYKAKAFKGLSLPNPAKASVFQNWVTPDFTSKSFHSFLKPMDVVSVEVTGSVDAVTPCRTDVKWMTDQENYENNISSFSNPSYSKFCCPPVSSLTAGSLEPCAADSPYGLVSCHGDEEITRHDADVPEKNIEVKKLLSKCSSNSESIPMISDYEKVEKLQFVCFRLESVDSGMFSGEEVSQENMEADSINATDAGSLGKEEKEAQDVRNGSFQMLFGKSGIDFDKESIKVFCDYKRVTELQAASTEFPTLEPGINSGGEEGKDSKFEVWMDG
ncbi:uncharacterized protein ACNS7B_007423 [Menidia menidia]